MRIVAGKHRGRAIIAPPGRAIRPTADRVRESIFNILRHGLGPDAPALEGARVLDVFCGTGSMGLEALSRGAAHATFMDTDIGPVRANVEALGEAARAELIAGDCTRPGPAPMEHHLAFLDPPYRQGLASPALAALAGAGWLTTGAVCVVELGSKETLDIPDAFSRLDSRRYGAAQVLFLRHDGGSPAAASLKSR